MRQRAGSFQVVPTRPVNPALYIEIYDESRAPDNMMNKGRFHNQLALNLGYQRIVNDKRINISIDDKQYPNDVMISLCVDGLSSPICYKASEGLSQNDMDSLDENSYDDIKVIVDAVYLAYLQAITNPF